MENYDAGYLSVVSPMIIIQSDHQYSDVVYNYMKAYDVTGMQWDNSILRNRLHNTKYLIRKQHFEMESEVKDASETHSINSPFNVDSDLFPNGVLSIKWFNKYLQHKPFCIIKLWDLPEDALHDEALASDINHLKHSYDNLGTKLVVVMISHNHDVSGDDDRINRLRQLTSLTRLTGLMYVPYGDKFDRDMELLVNNLLVNLKTPAVEFYTAIEHKIKQRNKKYYSIPSSANIDTTIELTPKTLETRNLLKQGIISQYCHPNNLEPSIKFFEVAYSNLIEIIRDNYFEFTKDTISHHDLQLYHQLRTLVDISAFHIVRGYISLEEPLIAIKKHQTHILNVQEMVNDKITIHQWQSIQYEWLYELLSLVPGGIATTMGNVKKGVKFFGGVKFNEYEVLTSLPLILLKSVNYLKPDINNQLNFLSDMNEEQLTTKKLQLLLQSSKLEKEPKILNYINYLIGEEYYKLGDEKSVEYFERSISGSETIDNVISNKLIYTYEKSNNFEKSLPIILKLSNSSGSQFPFIKPVPLVSKTIDLKTSLFEVNSLFVDQHTLEGKLIEVSVYDKLIGQLKFTPKLSIDVLKRYFGDITVDLIIKEINIKFKAAKLPDLVFKHDDSRPLNEISYNHGNFTVLDSNVKKFTIMEFSKIIEKSGTYEIETIELTTTLKINNSTNSLIINSSESISPKTIPYNWYTKENDNNQLISIPIKSRNAFSNSITVYPIKPNISVNLINPLESIIIGEKIQFSFKISFKNERKLNYNKVSLSPRIKVTDDDELITSNIHWENLKDDEPLVLNNVDTEESVNCKLNISIKSSSLQSSEILKNNGQQYKVMIDLKTLVEESDEMNVVIYDAAQYVINLINEPFTCKFAISPRVRDGHEDMPNPFILQDNKNSSMPIVTRVWQGKLSLSEQGLEIGDINYSIKSKSPEINIHVLEESNKYQQYFTTKSKNGISQRNVSIIINGEIHWRRPSTESWNVYKTQEWEILLPLADPRVLLNVENIDITKKLVKLKYIIENPTPRIFQFQTKLIDENERFVWNLEHPLNLSPLVINKFPVLPFNNFIMEYFATYNASSEIIELPQLKVLDLQYKVMLPTLPVNNDIIIKDNILFWRTTKHDTTK